MAEPIKPTRIVYRKDGDPVEMYAIDAQHAVTQHPKEWSFEPWDGSEGPQFASGELRPVVPNGWIDLRPSEKIALARGLGAKDVRSGAAAEEFINDYLVARANAGAVDEPAKPAATDPAAQA